MPFWLSRTGMLSILTSALNFTRSIGFHVLVCRMFGACFAVHPSNWLLPSSLQLEVSVGLGCEARHLRFILRIILRVNIVPPDLSINLRIHPFRVG